MLKSSDAGKETFADCISSRWTVWMHRKFWMAYKDKWTDYDITNQLADTHSEALQSILRSQFFLVSKNFWNWKIPFGFVFGTRCWWCLCNMCHNCHPHPGSWIITGAKTTTVRLFLLLGLTKLTKWRVNYFLNQQKNRNQFVTVDLQF